MGCWAEEGSAAFGAAELGLESPMLSVVELVVSVTLGFCVRVEVMGSSAVILGSEGVEVGSARVRDLERRRGKEIYQSFLYHKARLPQRCLPPR